MTATAAFPQAIPDWADLYQARDGRHHLDVERCPPAEIDRAQRREAAQGRKQILIRDRKVLHLGLTSCGMKTDVGQLVVTR